MSEQDFDNIPLLDDLIKKGDQPEQNQSTTHSDLEQKIHNILQRHTSQATAEILAMIDAQKENIN